MLRLAGLCIAVLALATACALTEPLPPPGTVPVQLQVANRSPRPVELSVRTGGRTIPGAVLPPSVAAGATTDVVFHVPMASEWEIDVNDTPLLMRLDLKGRTGAINNLGIEIDRDGGIGWWCNANC